jgi:hypothetical protein
MSLVAPKPLETRSARALMDDDALNEHVVDDDDVWASQQ